MHWVERYGMENRLSLLEQACIYDLRELPVSLEETVGYKPIADVPAGRGKFKPARLGQSWGPRGRRSYFKAVAGVPAEWRGRRVVFTAQLGGQCLLYVDGQPQQGIDGSHPFAVLAENTKGGERFDLILEAIAASNPWMPDHGGSIQHFAIGCVNKPLWDFCCDAMVLMRIAVSLVPQVPPGQGRMPHPNAGSSREWKDNAQAEKVFAALRDALMLFDWTALGQVNVGPQKTYAIAVPPQRPQVTPQSAERLAADAVKARKLLAPLLAQGGGQGRFTVVPVPSSHLDVAWLWPLSESVRKMARTTASVLALMDQYPRARFGQSQALIYGYLKDNYPSLYARLKQRVKQGRWEVLGGMWVECDTNMPCGESLIRQFLVGKKFFQREFGVEPRVVWLPDVFGLSPSLPQIYAGCGMTGAFTAKQATNEDTQFPYSVFRWQGLDGTSVLAHCTLMSYNDTISPAHVLDARHCFREKQQFDATLMPWGLGDGGGGPTAVEYEVERRLADLAELPAVDAGVSVQEFFDRLAKADRLPTWRGEIYQGAHRGTYTTVAAIKKYNRLCELRLREAEMLAVITGQPRKAPAEELWQTLLTMQFHDILPGSSIDMVNAENVAALKKCHEAAVACRDSLLAGVAKAGEGQTVFNPHSWERTDLVTVRQAVEGTQRTADGTLALVNVPALAAAAAKPVAAPFAAKATKNSLENRRFSIRMDAAGRITSMFDKLQKRELIPAGNFGNELRLHTDIPGPNCYGGNNDAWDISEFHRREYTVLEEAGSVTVTEQGPLRAAVRVVHKFGKSTLTQDIRVYGHSDRIDFATHVDWHENNRMLRAHFPAAMNAEQALCEVAFGHCSRPTTANTIWEWSQFEVPCHRWADICEGGYGVALLNDCKYGYDVQHGGLSLTLLRSTSAPDPVADRGENTFTYAFLGHEGGPLEGGVIREAYALNAPLLTVRGRPRETGSFLTVDQPNVIVETIKPAEDGKGHIVRLYECANRRTRARIAGRFSRVTRCDMLERPAAGAAKADGELELEVRPFEVVTLRME